MATIEERARLCSMYTDDKLLRTIVYHSYKVGAIEQQKIDLDKACKWLRDCLPNIEYITNASVLRQNKEKFIESFRKTMEGENND